MVRVTTDALRFEVDSRTAMYSAQAVVVARVRDGLGRGVQKVSQQYVLNGAADEISGARKGEILFYREMDLPAGAYQVESIVYDVLAQTGSARAATLVVPEADAQELQMSSLVLVSRTEQVADQDAAAGDRVSPFYLGRMLLYPNVGEPLARGSHTPLGFYFVVYPDEPTRRCTAQISLLRNGASIAEVSRPLEATAGARLPHVGHLPIDNLPSGVYELRVTVTDGARRQTRAAFFTVA